MMVENGEGIIIYLPQKEEILVLQIKLEHINFKDGLDTVDANLTLGFRDDERSYDVAISILKKLNFKTINLISNNPSKVRVLNEEGLKVLNIIKLEIEPNEINKNYKY